MYYELARNPKTKWRVIQTSKLGEIQSKLKCNLIRIYNPNIAQWIRHLYYSGIIYPKLSAEKDFGVWETGNKFNFLKYSTNGNFSSFFIPTLIKVAKSIKKNSEVTKGWHNDSFYHGIVWWNNQTGARVGVRTSWSISCLDGQDFLLLYACSSSWSTTMIPLNMLHKGYRINKSSTTLWTSVNYYLLHPRSVATPFMDFLHMLY